MDGMDSILRVEVNTMPRSICTISRNSALLAITIYNDLAIMIYNETFKTHTFKRENRQLKQRFLI